MRESRGKFRVLHVGKYYPPHPGGMETHLETLCRALSPAADVQVLVANDERRSANESSEGIRVTRVGKMLDFAAAPVCPGMVHRLRAAAADVIHFHLPNPTAILAYLGSGKNGPLVASYHSDIVRQKFLAKGFWPLLRCFLDRCAAIVVSSPNYLESSPVLRRYAERCRTIPYGIPVSQFDASDHSRVADIRERFGPRIVLGVGRHIYYKGFKYLIRAMGRVDAHLLLVGDGPLRQGLEAEVAAMGLGERVVFVGNVPDVRPYYHAADVFVLPSVARSEAFGIVQLEAMAAGRPVVNTRIDSGAPFVSPHGVTGLTVPPRDSDALADAINLLLRHDSLREEYGEAARRRVREQFTVERMAAQTLQVYEEVMARAERGQLRGSH